MPVLSSLIRRDVCSRSRPRLFQRTSSPSSAQSASAQVFVTIFSTIFCAIFSQPLRLHLLLRHRPRDLYGNTVPRCAVRSLRVAPNRIGCLYSELVSAAPASGGLYVRGLGRSVYEFSTASSDICAAKRFSRPLVPLDTRGIFS